MMMMNSTLGWIDEICSRITKDLVDTNKPFKYLGTNTFISSVPPYFPQWSSLLCNRAEERSRASSRSFMLLGQCERQCCDHQMAQWEAQRPQCSSRLHRQRLWARLLKQSNHSVHHPGLCASSNFRTRKTPSVKWSIMNFVFDSHVAPEELGINVNCLKSNYST